MKCKIFLMAALISSSTLYAQQDSTSVLDEVVVTATKYPLKQSQTGKVITVISQEELQKNTGRSLSDVLNMQTGIIVNGVNGVRGTNQDIYTRGAAAGKTLILIDGVPVYDVSGISGAFDINFIPLENIEKIEILKGSQSTLYGSDAIAGVINIITKKGGAKKLGANLLLAGGTYDTFKSEAGINGTVDKTSYNLQYGFENSKGFSAANDRDNSGTFDRDGFDRQDFRANISQKISDAFSVFAQAGYNKYNIDVDAAAFKDDADYSVKNKNTQLGIGAKYTKASLSFQLNYLYNTTERNYLDDSLSRGGFSFYSTGNYKGKGHFAELSTRIAATQKIDLIAGVDYRSQNTDQDYFSKSSFGPFATSLSSDSSNVQQLGAYGSLIFKDFSGFNLELGGRYNNFNKYGNVFTYSINPSYNINKQVKIFSNLSTGFKTPSLYQVYSEYRNPTTELKPEHSTSLEGGAAYEKENLMVRAVYFYRKIKDNIIFFSSGAPNFESYYVNADKQIAQGLELETKYTFNNVTLVANYTNLDGKLQTKVNGMDTSFTNLYRRPTQTINLQLGIDITKKIAVQLSTQSIGRRFEAVFALAPREMPAYNIWNVHAQYLPVANLKIFADLRNITDAAYQEVLGYNSRGFNVLAGIRLSF